MGANKVSAAIAAQVHIGTMLVPQKGGRKRKICYSDTAAKVRHAVEDGLAVTTASRLLSNVWESPNLFVTWDMNYRGTGIQC